MTMLQCTRCKSVKPTADFYMRRDRPKARPLQPCRACKVEVAREQYIRTRPVIPEGQKRCPRCQRILPLHRFGENRARHDDKQVYCAECWPEVRKRYPRPRPSLETVPTATKRCSQCGETKPLEQFRANSVSRDGHHSFCVPCQDAYLQRRRPRRRPPKPPKGYQRCSGCQQVKPIDDFGRDRSRPTGRRAPCKVCARADRLRQRRSSPEFKRRQQARAFTSLAVQLGLLARQPCEMCGDPKSQAHHVSYERPLEGLRWLCTRHHVAAHGGFYRRKNIGEGGER